ncbi:MAG: DUF3299 domain-containing protein, partial [Pirellulaceae bacterium]|nr:DUF3299 domain-containing protein [Pirellulaceae bacterium]
AAALALYALAGGAGKATDQARAAYRFKEIRWEALIPKDWDPIKRFQNSNRGVVDDSDPYAQRLMRAIWDNAPTVAAMDDAAISLQGYVVPLEESKEGLKEFLLVPYFGACLHSPPPPANQIVHVVVAPPVKGIRTMDVVWVSGTLETTRRESSMGMSGYALNAVAVNSASRPGSAFLDFDIPAHTFGH